MCNQLYMYVYVYVLNEDSQINVEGVYYLIFNKLRLRIANNRFYRVLWDTVRKDKC